MSTKEEIEVAPAGWEFSPGFSNVVTASGGDGYGYFYYYKHKQTKKPVNYFAPIPSLLKDIYMHVEEKRRLRESDAEIRSAAAYVLSETKRILGEK